MKIFKKLGFNPTNVNLYYQAFTHTSFSNENPSFVSYERLEFLGDAILEFIISEYLYKEKKLEEGLMTRMRASYVCEEACATYAKEIGLDEDIRVGSGETLNQTITADVFEAFVAALYLDQGFEFTKDFVLGIITKYIEDGVNAPTAEVYDAIIRNLKPGDKLHAEMDQLYTIIRGTPPPDVCDIVRKNNGMNDALRVVKDQELSAQQIASLKTLLTSFKLETAKGEN